MNIHFLCSRPYWRRLWILQEIILAAEVTIRCGTFRIAWHSLETILEVVKNTSKLQNFLYTNFKMKPLAIYRHRRHRKLLGQQTHTLYELCKFHEDSECIDSRDKIFGLLGLSQSCCQEHVPADYRKHTFEVKEMLIRHHVRCHATESHSRLSFEDISQYFNESNSSLKPWEKLAIQDILPEENVYPGPLLATIHKQKMDTSRRWTVLSLQYPPYSEVTSSILSSEKK